MKFNIIYIQKKQVKAVCVKLGKKTAAIKKSQVFDLAQQSLEEIFKAIKKSFGSQVRVLLEDDIFCLYTFTISAQVKEVKAAVEKKLTTLVTEPLTEVAWDFQEIGQTSEHKIIQVAALKKELLDKIINLAESQGLQIEALEPVAYSLAKLSDEGKVHLLLYPQAKKVLALVVEKNKVLNSVFTSKPEKLEKLLDFIKKNFKLEVAKVVLPEELPQEFMAFCTQKDLEIKTQNFNPVFGLALESKSLLTILPQKEVSMSEETNRLETSSIKKDFGPLEEQPKKKKKGKKLFWLVFLGLVITGTVYGAKKLPFLQPEPSPSPTPTPEPVVEEVVVEPELERSDLKVKVLNGSGTAGVAGSAQEYLEDLGYEDVEVGNAEEFDYEDVQIEMKDDKKEYLDMLVEDLAEKYTVVEDTSTLDEDSDFDAMIIIGKEEE